MSQRPVAIGLLLCEQLIVEEGTKNASLVNCFTQRIGESFPWTVPPFTVAAWLRTRAKLTSTTFLVWLDGVVPFAVEGCTSEFQVCHLLVGDFDSRVVCVFIVTVHRFLGELAQLRGGASSRMSVW